VQRLRLEPAGPELRVASATEEAGALEDLECLQIAGMLISNGAASSFTDASPSIRRIRMARRVGLAMAESVRLTWHWIRTGHVGVAAARGFPCERELVGCGIGWIGIGRLRGFIATVAASSIVPLSVPSSADGRRGSKLALPSITASQLPLYSAPTWTEPLAPDRCSSVSRSRVGRADDEG
jgi:hypothetical protein